VALEQRQCLAAVARGFGGHAGFFQRKADDVADVGVIIDHEDAVRQAVLSRQVGDCTRAAGAGASLSSR